MPVTRVVAVDADPSAVGMRLAHGGGVVPLGTDPAFVPALCEIATDHEQVRNQLRRVRQKLAQLN